MTRVERDDLPRAPGVEDIGPLGSLVRQGGSLFRIPHSASRFDPRPAEPAVDAAALRDAASRIAKGYVLVSRHTHAGQRQRLTTRVDATLGVPERTLLLGRGQEIRWYGGAVLALLDGASTLACATLAEVAGVLGPGPVEAPSLAPAAFEYRELEALPALGGCLGRVAHAEHVHARAFALHEAEGGCVAVGRLRERFELQFAMLPGGVVAAPARWKGRFPGAARFGLWQSSLVNTDRLRALLAEHGAKGALSEAVLAAEAALGGFGGERGVELIAPWAACEILAETAPGIWAGPRHPYNGAWFVGWAMVAQVRVGLSLDERGRVWASWQDAGDDEVQIRLVGEDLERWFSRQLFLLEHGYASEATATLESALPDGLSAREDLSDAVARVYEEPSRDAVWLVEEGRVQRMSRVAADADAVIAIAARFG